MLTIQLPKNIRTLLQNVPEADRPQGDNAVYFWQCVAAELAACFQEAIFAKEPQVVFQDFRKAGEQYIWEFYVNDLAKPRTDQVNFHMQNTSQWLYAGCILLQGGRVSTHH